MEFVQGLLDDEQGCVLLPVRPGTQAPVPRFL